MARYLTDPLTKEQIELANSKTKSASAAARYLRVHYVTYKKYAEMYGLFEQQKNPSGTGVIKPRTVFKEDLFEVVQGNGHFKDTEKLMYLLFDNQLKDKRCEYCDFDEARIVDGKIPLDIRFRDGNAKNQHLDNIDIVCYNCSFINFGTDYFINMKELSKTAIKETIKK